MEVLISRRHTDAHPKLQNYIERKLERLQRIYDHLQGVSVVLDDAGGRHAVEISANAERGTRFASHAEGETWHESFNLAETRLEAQVRRHKQRRVDRRRRA